MESLICTAVLIPVAYAAYKKSKKSKEEGKGKEAIVWMVVSVLAGAFAVAQILALFA